MKSKEGKLSLDFMGGLTKFGPKDYKVRKFQIKTIGNGNDSEIDGIARAFGKWADHGLIPELANFGEKVPTATIPWKIAIPLADCGIYVDIDFAHDPYTDEQGTVFQAMLTDISFSVKKGEREAVMTFLKNGDDQDDAIQHMYFNIKEENDKGKMVPKAFRILIDECESFQIGNPPEEPEGDDDDGDVEPVVYEAP
jgi:hypothetical protein